MARFYIDHATSCCSCPHLVTLASPIWPSTMVGFVHRKLQAPGIGSTSGFRVDGTYAPQVVFANVEFQQKPPNLNMLLPFLLSIHHVPRSRSKSFQKRTRFGGESKSTEEPFKEGLVPWIGKVPAVRTWWVGGSLQNPPTAPIGGGGRIRLRSATRRFDRLCESQKARNDTPGTAQCSKVWLLTWPKS